MKKDVLIQAAMTALVDSGIAVNDSAPKAYNGAIASFGASLIQSGLLATLAIYNHDSGEASRPKILRALYQVLQTARPALRLPQVQHQEKAEEKLLKYALKQDKDQRYLLETWLAEAAVALKLALRTFKLEDNG